MMTITAGSAPEPVCRPCRRERRKTNCQGCGRKFDGRRTASGQRTSTSRRYCTPECKPGPGLPRHQVLIGLASCRECKRDLLVSKRFQWFHERCGSRSRNRSAHERGYHRAWLRRRLEADPGYRTTLRRYGRDAIARRLGFRSNAELFDWLRHKSKGLCGICGEPVTGKTGPMMESVDHIIPVSRGGRDEESNLQLAHLRCNISKGDRVQPTLLGGTNREHFTLP